MWMWNTCTQNVHWMDLLSNSSGANSVSVLTDSGRKRLEAVWELFQSEIVFLIDHLMVLKHVRVTIFGSLCVSRVVFRQSNKE